MNLSQMKCDALAGLKAGGCPKEGIKGCLKAIILNHINELNNLDRLKAVLDEHVLDHDPATRANNLHYLFPIAEAEVLKLQAFAKECREIKINRNMRIARECAKEFEQEAKEWERLAEIIAQELGLEPDLRKRHWFAISHFHGFREKLGKDGKLQRVGGHWSTPTHKDHNSFLTNADAESYAEMQYGLLRKWSEKNGLECPYKIVDIGTKYGDILK